MTFIYGGGGTIERALVLCCAGYRDFGTLNERDRLKNGNVSRDAKDIKHKGHRRFDGEEYLWKA